jgi:hypothetical protein
MAIGQQEEQATKVNLEVTVEELNIIITGLVKLPYEASARVIDVVRSQATRQLQSREEQGHPLHG